MPRPKGFKVTDATRLKLRQRQLELIERKQKGLPLKMEKQIAPKAPREYVIVGGAKLRRPEADAGSKVLTVEEWREAVRTADTSLNDSDKYL